MLRISGSAVFEYPKDKLDEIRAFFSNSGIVTTKKWYLYSFSFYLHWARAWVGFGAGFDWTLNNARLSEKVIAQEQAIEYRMEEFVTWYSMYDCLVPSILTPGFDSVWHSLRMGIMFADTCRPVSVRVLVDVEFHYESKTARRMLSTRYSLVKSSQNPSLLLGTSQSSLYPVDCSKNTIAMWCKLV